MDKLKEIKSMFAKTTPEDLQMYLQFRRRGFKVPAKKGKGSFTRKIKHKLKYPC